MPPREQIGALLAGARARAVTVAPELMGPFDDPPAGIERRAHPHHHSGAVWLPLEFVFPHPLHANRSSGHRAREQRGIERHIVGAVVTVAPGAFGMRHDDVVFGHP